MKTIASVSFAFAHALTYQLLIIAAMNVAEEKCSHSIVALRGEEVVGKDAQEQKDVRAQTEEYLAALNTPALKDEAALTVEEAKIGGRTTSGILAYNDLR